MNDVIAALPEKGEKRVKAIAALGNSETNAQALLALCESEKGKCKTTALKTLALFDYKPAAPLWKKLANGKYSGESVLMPSCSDCVSQEAAPVITRFFSYLFALPAGTALNSAQFEKFQLCISIMLGKASEAMLDVYRLAAENSSWIGNMKKEALYPGDRKLDTWVINDYIRIWNAAPGELEKIFPAVLTASIIRSADKRLAALADELFAKYGGAWLIPVFMNAILTRTKEEVYEEYSAYLNDDKTAVYLYNALGVLCYEDSYKGFEKQLEVQGKRKGYYAVVFWGSYSYGVYNTRMVFDRPAELDRRWLFRLAQKPEEQKSKVTLQTYNRRMGGVKFEDYDEMLLELLPLEVEDGELKQLMAGYFKQRKDTDAGGTMLYRDARKRFLE